MPVDNFEMWCGQLSKTGKLRAAEQIMKELHGRSDLGAVHLARVLAKRLSGNDLLTFLHVIRNPGETP